MSAPAYFLANVNVRDAGAYPDYVAAVSPTVARHGGRYLVRGGDTRVVEGGWTPHRVVLMGYPDNAALDAWLDDPETRAAFAIRHRIATSQTAAFEGLEDATATGGAYVLANVCVRDTDAYEDYRARVGPVVVRYDGTFLVRGGTHRVIEGDWRPARLVLLAFPDMTAAERFYGSPEYAPLLALRKAAATSEVAFIAGVD